MLDIEHRLFAIEDIRQRQTAQCSLVESMDQKAMSLLTLYVTLGIACAGLALSVFSEDPLIGRSAAFGLAAAFACLLAGAFSCFRTMESAEIPLPGRSPAFWKHALDQSGDEIEGVTRTYLVDAIGDHDAMKALNARMGKQLRWAKGLGVAAPVAAATVGLFAQRFFPGSTSSLMCLSGIG